MITTELHTAELQLQLCD